MSQVCLCLRWLRAYPFMDFLCGYVHVSPQGVNIQDLVLGHCVVVNLSRLATTLYDHDFSLCSVSRQLKSPCCNCIQGRWFVVLQSSLYSI